MHARPGDGQPRGDVRATPLLSVCCPASDDAEDGTKPLPEHIYKWFYQKQRNGLGDFRAILQTPGTRRRTSATVVDTFPPWDPGDVDIDSLKQHGSVATDLLGPQPVFTGKGVNAGNQEHSELLRTAKEELEQRGFAVKTLYQGAGDDNPDGDVKMRDGSIAHLEAERGTL